MLKFRIVVVVLLLVGLLASTPLLARKQTAEQDLFVGGHDGYQCFRIPSIVVTPTGAIIALAEGRKNGSGDAGDIDTVVRRSTDGGITWSELSVVWDDGQNTCGNPCAVVDQDSGTIFLLSTWNRGGDHEAQIIGGTSKDTRRIFLTSSTDDGITWSASQEITSDVKQSDWTWYATGPGSGIQIKHGSHEGRLVIPCDHIESKTKSYYSHAIYSDDRGASWKFGESTPKDRVNECEVVELAEGKLMLNMRNYDQTIRARQIAISIDGKLSLTTRNCL